MSPVSLICLVGRLNFLMSMNFPFLFFPNKTNVLMPTIQKFKFNHGNLTGFFSCFDAKILEQNVY